MAMASPQRSLLLSVLLLLVSVSWGLRVERTDSPSVWVLRTGDDDALRSIVSSTFAQIYVLYAPSSDATALATVRFQGGYPPQTRRSSGLSSPSPGSLRISSRSAVEVTVHVKEQLHHIQTTSYGSIVIDHDVLVSDDSTAIVTAVASSTGSVYLPPHVRLHVSSLSLQSRSYGSVFLVASDIAVDSLDLQVRSTGSAKLHADSITVKGTVSVGVESYGSASLSAVSLHATQLDVTTTSTGAAGVIATREDSTVEQCHLKQLSFGEIQAGSVVCTNAIVENDGYNCVVVRVSDSLVYSSSSFGHVYYTGARPKTIMSTSEQESPHSVEPAEGSADAPAEPKWAVTYTLPPHKPFDHSSLESLQVRGSESLDLRTNASTYEFPWLFLGVAVIAAVVYGVKRTASPRRQRERRNENAPLLKDNVPASV